MNLKKISLAILVIATMFSIALIGSYSKVSASDIMPFSVYQPSTVGFYGSYNGPGYYCDGNYAYCEIQATASDGVARDLIVEVYIDSTKMTYKYQTPTDGKNRRTYDIPINGGSTVKVSASCSDSSVKINMTYKIRSFY